MAYYSKPKNPDTLYGSFRASRKIGVSEEDTVASDNVKLANMI